MQTKRESAYFPPDVIRAIKDIYFRRNGTTHGAIQDALVRGAFLVLAELKGELPIADLDKLNKFARERGITLTELVAWNLSQYLSEKAKSSEESNPPHGLPPYNTEHVAKAAQTLTELAQNLAVVSTELRAAVEESVGPDIPETLSETLSRLEHETADAAESITEDEAAIRDNVEKRKRSKRPPDDRATGRSA